MVPIPHILKAEQVIALPLNNTIGWLFWVIPFMSRLLKVGWLVVLGLTAL